MTFRVAVAGATGRLGTLVCDVVDRHPDFELVARLGRESAADAGDNAEILIDVTHPGVSPAIVQRAITRGQRVIVGTSGWSAERLTDLAGWLADRPATAAIVVPNFSLGSVVGTALARLTAPYFDAVEIIETHHPAKVDSPSGTAVRTAELMAQERAGRPVAAPFAEQPARGQLVAGIPVHSLRLAGVLAKQEVRFGGAGETLTITHETLSHESYRAGITAALEAIITAAGLTVGLDELLGLGAAGFNR